MSLGDRAEGRRKESWICRTGAAMGKPLARHIPWVLPLWPAALPIFCGSLCHRAGLSLQITPNSPGQGACHCADRADMIHAPHVLHMLHKRLKAHSNVLKSRRGHRRAWPWRRFTMPQAAQALCLPSGEEIVNTLLCRAVAAQGARCGKNVCITRTNGGPGIRNFPLLEPYFSPSATAAGAFQNTVTGFHVAQSFRRSLIASPGCFSSLPLYHSPGVAA